ncbi:hypothetical protein [Flavobacterium hibisci]|uniref:hypothetical protein n=1 Tax=Flavobacterium hibisci TaxID=1914462 RepID=UPI001CBD361C|nr:hypothetical protein [Flavobacterium hibisci]MBZ4042594.1 hypothetical protein [Flavobacterium hibisci]
MKIAIDIVQFHLVPKLRKATDLGIQALDEFFWENFTNSLLNFETDPKSLYQFVLMSNISSTIKERIISKTPRTYSILISELAEEYVKGNTSEAIKMLLNSKGNKFKEEISFLSTLPKAIRIVEKNSLKSELPGMFEKLQNRYLDGNI